MAQEGEFVAADDPQGRLREYFTESAPAAVVSAYLFGSHARGTPHRDSDLDVAVLLHRALAGSTAERGELRVRLASDLIATTGNNRVDLVVLNDAPPELGRAIVTRGRRIFTRDAEADHAYVRDIQLRAADLAPWLARMRRIKLEVLRR